MVDRARIQTYAQELRDQEVFLGLVLYYVASRLQHEILNADEATDTLLSDGLIIKEYQIEHLRDGLKDFLIPSEFWEFCAEQILVRIEDWKRTGERPANIGSGGLATGFRNPRLSKFKEEADKEAEVRDRFAADAADWLIARLAPGQLEVAALEELTGLKLVREQLKSRTTKLSQLQTKILLKLLEVAKGYRNPVPWTPAAWFGEQSDSDRAAISRALKKLEERGLVVRKSLHHKGQPKRTANLELTDLGWRSAKLLTRKKGRST